MKSIPEAGTELALMILKVTVIVAVQPTPIVVHFC
jgi:hypothetical protein